MATGLLCLKWNNHNGAFLQLLKNIHSTGLYCDVTIACHGKYYPVHRMVLSICSEYFEEIFKMTPCKHPFIIVNDITPSVLESLLNYMYKGEMNVLQECLPDLMKAAEALKVKGLAVPDEVSSNDGPKTPKEKKRNGNFTGFGSNSKRSRSSEKAYGEGEAIEELYQINPNGVAKWRMEESSNYLISNTSSIKNVDNRTSSNGSIELEADNIKMDPLCTPESTPETSANIYMPHLGTETILIKEEVTTEELSSTNNPIKSEEDGSNNESISDPISMTQIYGAALSPETQLEMDDSTDNSFLSAVAEDDYASTYNATINKHSRACPYCPYYSTKTSHIKRHIQYKHTLERPFGCTFCNSRFTENSTLKNHLQRRHAGAIPLVERCKNA